MRFCNVLQPMAKLVAEYGHTQRQRTRIRGIKSSVEYSFT
jgi:hypothetical protein